MSLALVTGAAGQDGGYLVDRLLGEGHEVHGLVRAEDRPEHPPAGLTVHELDLAAPAAELTALVSALAPDEIYHLGGITSVAQSWADPLGTLATCGTAAPN